MFQNIALDLLQIYIVAVAGGCKQEIKVYEKDEIIHALTKYHLFVGLNYNTTALLQNISFIYRDDNIRFGLYFGDVLWESQSVNPRKTSEHFALYRKLKEDRKCLLKPQTEIKPKAVAMEVKNGKVADVIEFINRKCVFFKDVNGQLTEPGARRKKLVQSFYHVKNSVNRNCEEIEMPTKEEFVTKYLFHSKPVIFKNAIRHWPAIKKWSSDFLRYEYGEKQVHVKLTEDGEFEGCDKADKFENFARFQIPKQVIKQLNFPDLVVVRPAVANIKFSKFLDIIENRDRNYKNVSAYLEYSSVREYFPELEEDIWEIPVVKDLLHLLHLNIWISNGNTLGKLHFDPYDNFLCQLSGKKQLTLFEPHNNYNLYEGHIQEAILSYNLQSNKFMQDKVLDSTSMVMSPVDIANPDIDRFFNFTKAIPMKCLLKEGDVLYMPAFWWHEVQSYPHEKDRRNLAVNFWYEPFFNKEYPCPECKMDVNPYYEHLLSFF